MPRSEVVKQTMSRYSFHERVSNAFSLTARKLTATSDRISHTTKGDIPRHSSSVVVKGVNLSSLDTYQSTVATTVNETVNVHPHVMATIPTLKVFPSASVKLSTMTPTMTIVQLSNASTNASVVIRHSSEPSRLTAEHFKPVDDPHSSTVKQEPTFTSQYLHFTRSSTTAEIPRESIRLSSPITNGRDSKWSLYDATENLSTKLGLKITISEAKKSVLVNKSRLDLQSLNTISASYSPLIFGNNTELTVAAITTTIEEENAKEMSIATVGTVSATAKLTADAGESMTNKTSTTNAKTTAATAMKSSIAIKIPTARVTEQNTAAITTTAPASAAAATTTTTTTTTKLIKEETVYSEQATEIFSSRKLWHSSGSVVRLVKLSVDLHEENLPGRSSAQGKPVISPSTQGQVTLTQTTREKLALTLSTQGKLTLTSAAQEKFVLTLSPREELVLTPSKRGELNLSTSSYVMPTPSEQVKKSKSEENYFNTISSLVGLTHSAFRSFSVLQEIKTTSANQSWSIFLPQKSWRQTSVSNDSFDLLKSSTVHSVSGVLQASGVTMLFSSSLPQVVTSSPLSLVMTSSTAGEISYTSATLEYRYTEGSMRLVNVDYHQNLSDSNTTMFQTLATSVEQILSDILAGNEIKAEDIQVTEFRNGSVLVFFSIKLSSKYNYTADVIRAVLRDSNTSFWRGYKVGNFTLRERLPSTPVPKEGDRGRREAEENDNHVVIPLVIAMVMLLLVVCFLGYRHCKRRDWHRRRRVKPKG